MEDEHSSDSFFEVDDYEDEDSKMNDGLRRRKQLWASRPQDASADVAKNSPKAADASRGATVLASVDGSLERTASVRKHRRTPALATAVDEPGFAARAPKSRSICNQLVHMYFSLALLGASAILLILALAVRKARRERSNTLLFAAEQLASWVLVRMLVAICYAGLRHWFSNKRVTSLLDGLGFDLTTVIWAVAHIAVVPNALDDANNSVLVFKLYLVFSTVYAANAVKCIVIQLWLVRFHVEVLKTQLSKLVSDERAVFLLRYAQPEDEEEDAEQLDLLANVDNQTTLLKAASHDLESTFQTIMRSAKRRREVKTSATDKAEFASSNQNLSYNTTKEELRRQAETQADEILANCDRAGKGFISLTDIDLLTQRDEESDFVLRCFVSEPETSIAREDLIKTLMSIEKSRRLLYDTIYDRGQLSDVLHRASAVAFFVLAAIYALVIFNADFFNLILPFATFMLSLSFVFADVLKQSFASLLFLFAARPFAVGDRITMEGYPTLIVDRIKFVRACSRRAREVRLTRYAARARTLCLCATVCLRPRRMPQTGAATSCPTRSCSTLCSSSTAGRASMRCRSALKSPHPSRRRAGTS